MRIILTNNHLAQFGGTESWTLTMTRELIRQGHDVGVFTHHKGVVSNLLKDHLDDYPQDYDLALINHNSCRHIKAKKRIFTSHGWVPELEHPPAGFDEYVAVSENVSKKWDIPLIIKNPVDTELYKPAEPIGETPLRRLAITSHPLNMNCFYPTRVEETMPELMKKADLVITAGRGVLEAMSTARNVVVYDKRPGLGMCADGYLQLPITGNVGGEYKLKTINLDVEIAKYKQEHGERNRDYILEHHDVKKIVEQYLNL